MAVGAGAFAIEQVVVHASTSWIANATLIVQCVAVVVAMTAAGVAIWSTQSNRSLQATRSARQILSLYEESTDDQVGSCGRVTVINASNEIITHVVVTGWGSIAVDRWEWRSESVKGHLPSHRVYLRAGDQFETVGTFLSPEGDSTVFDIDHVSMTTSWTDTFGRQWQSRGAGHVRKGERHALRFRARRFGFILVRPLLSRVNRWQARRSLDRLNEQINSENATRHAIAKNVEAQHAGAPENIVRAALILEWERVRGPGSAGGEVFWFDVQAARIAGQPKPSL